MKEIKMAYREETLSHLYNDLIVTCGSSAAYEQVGNTNKIEKGIVK